MCPLGYTGYGYASLNIVKELHKNNDNICVLPIGQPNIDNEKDALIIKQYLDNIENVPYDAPSLKIWHQFDLLTRPGRGKYCAFPFFEIDTFSAIEKYHLNFPDLLLASCEWAKQILINNNIKTDIKVVPLGVDTSIFSPKPITKDPNKYIFCTIGKWEKRKNHDLIIECFNKAFTDSDEVELWMVTHNPFLNKQEEQYWLNLVSGSKLRNKIKVFPRLPSHESIAEVIGYSDCGLYISRGEGWNMELLESMAMNKPVIVSNYSAHTEYCNNSNAFIVDITETEPAHDDKWFFGQGNWAKFGQNQIDQTIEHMKYVYSNKIRDNKAGLTTAQIYSWTNTATKIRSVV